MVIATPARLNQHVKLNNVRLRESVEVLALDEADLLLSFGFEDDIKAITGELPNICQTLLMSATLGEDIDKASSRHLPFERARNARARACARAYVHMHTRLCECVCSAASPPSHSLIHLPVSLTLVPSPSSRPRAPHAYTRSSKHSSCTMQ